MSVGLSAGQQIHIKNRDLWFRVVAAGALDGILIRFGNSFHGRKGGSSVQTTGLRSDICGSSQRTP